MSEKILINKLPAPTFRWLKMNGAMVDAISSDVEKRTYSLDSDSKPLIIETDFNGNSSQNDITIDVAESADSYAVMNFVSEDANGVFGFNTGISLKKDSVLTLVQAQLLPDTCELRNDIHVTLEDGAKFNLIQVILSGNNTYIECTSELNGTSSSVCINAAYSMHGKESLDINYVANHYGKKTESLMNVYGVLSDEAKKIFRGTIDFKNGCAGAIGNENEDVLLLDDNIINQTIPLILCAEEDVEGNHGASLGRLSDDVMFYLKSRGMSEEHIYRMMARARIEAVAALIKDESTKKLITDYIG